MNTPVTIEEKYRSIVQLVNEPYLQKEEIDRLASLFKREGCVVMPSIFLPQIFEALKKEAIELTRYAVSKDFTMKGYGTPRLMSVVNATAIIAHSQLLWTLYSNHHLYNLFQAIVGEQIFPSKQPVAFMALNYLKGQSSTQGWHLDDGAFAVVYAFKVPGLEDGGVLEYIPTWVELCNELNVVPDIQVAAPVVEARRRNLVRDVRLNEGDCYILKSNTSLHRVSEMLSGHSDRLVLAVGYENKPQTTYTHTGSDLYADLRYFSPGKGYEVRHTNLKGEGVFATRSFHRGETVIVGRIEKYLSGNTSHASQIGKETFVLHSEDQTKINHSCLPNCGIRVNSTGAHDIVAMREIEVGAEITFDYAMRNYDVEFFPASCLYGSANCRGVITGWKALPHKQRIEYESFAAPYLRELE